MDTAGIHETDDTVEKIGVERSKKAANDASLVLAVFDASSDIGQEDKKILEIAKTKPHIIILNKCDIDKKAEITGIEISAKTGEGMEKLTKAIAEFANKDTTERESIITNERHLECLISCDSAIKRAVESAEIGMPSDMLAIDIKEAIESLGEITGQTVSQEIVDKVFHNFCLGK